MERLNKFLANAGVCSRRKADELILAGKIKVNNEVVTEMGHKIDPTTDVVEFDGTTVKYSTEFVYYALNKPKGVVSTAQDQSGDQTVVDLVPNSPRVYPVGRLDKETVGLIVLTNDGELTKEMTHPSFEHSKVYEVTVRISKLLKITHEGIKASFERGLQIEGNLMKADEVRNFQPSEKNPAILTFEIVLHTGYNRQVRKMCAKIDLEVVRLTRIGFGKLRLQDLNIAPGQYVEVAKSDIV